MTKREELQEKIRLNEIRMTELDNENSNLQIECHKISDDKQQYSEQIEKIARRDGRKKVYDNVLIGKIHWQENFIDEESGDVISISRHRVVRRNDRWFF